MGSEMCIRDRVVTEETSKISALLTGLITFAVPATLIVILFFTGWDLIRRKPQEETVIPEPNETSGELSPTEQRALPESSTTRLTVVDEDEADNDRNANDGDVIDVLSEEAKNDEFDGGDDEPPNNSKKSKKSKDDRWGRDASSKAG